MPVGVPKVLYYWDDELPLQWIDLYHLIFRRRLIFVMSELDQELCNQIAGMMIYIHFEDKRKELEKKGIQVGDIFEQTTESNDLLNKNETTKNLSYQLTYQDLMDYETIWDLEADIQSDYYMNIYNNKNVQDSWNDYYEHSFSDSSWISNQSNSNLFFYNNFTKPSKIKENSLFDSNKELNNLNISSNEMHLINQFKTYGYSNILKQYSNFFEQWATMIYALGDKVSNGYYYDKSRWVDPSKEKIQLLLQNQQLQDPIEKINQNLKTDMISELFLSKSMFTQKNLIYKTLLYYLNFLKFTNNTNQYSELIDRRCFKEDIKRNYSKDKRTKQLFGRPYTYLKAGLDINMLKTSTILEKKRKREEAEDLIFAESQERMQEQKRVFVFINSTGGSVHSGITVYDALQFVKAGTVTVCLGTAFSASSLVLAGGNIGHRYVSEGGHVMIHQPEGGIQGQASDVVVDTHELMRVRRQAATIYALCSKRSFHEILKDLDRDYFMTPQEAIDYGLADEIVTRYNSECILDEFEKDWLADDAAQIEGISKKIQQLSDDDGGLATGPQSRR
uniref:ATP-dependent Clp protease proteolytic subunit n=1 Tax=Oedogonium cardiacum TaxID=55995 RepID=B2X1V4_OEDCA|nr:ATP-dependent Clp protease proteolytic subunit [Oedogonium cardiacum]ABU88167.1 clp protease proteolytic subunit 2 [Oedogonium cardiacum]ACC97215.1 proteolytic subunit 2 of clp protease [Oedogonium cardiacum]